MGVSQSALGEDAFIVYLEVYIPVHVVIDNSFYFPIAILSCDGLRKVIVRC